MRLAGLGVLLLASGCATTVYRLDGELETSAGPARTVCEQDEWLVLAPTQAENVSPEGTVSEPRDDGLGVYDVGGQRPRSITRLERQGLGPSPLLPPHREGTRRYDQDRIISASLGSAGLILMAVGGALLATSFETNEVPTASGLSTEEEQSVNKGRATGSAVLMGFGLGLGIGGLVMTPTHAERARAQTYRYVFVPENDPTDEVKALIAAYNEDVRAECARSGKDEPLPEVPAEPVEEDAAGATDEADEAPAEEAPEEGASAPDDAAPADEADSAASEE